MKLFHSLEWDKKFGKEVCEDPYSTRKSQSHVRSHTKPYQYKLIQITVLPLRQDMMNRIPGTWRLQGVKLLAISCNHNRAVSVRTRGIPGFHERSFSCLSFLAGKSTSHHQNVHSFKMPFAWPQKKMNSSSVVWDQGMLRDLKRVETFWILEGSRLCHTIYLSILSFSHLTVLCEGDKTLLDQRPGIRCHRPDISQVKDHHAGDSMQVGTNQ